MIDLHLLLKGVSSYGAKYFKGNVHEKVGRDILLYHGYVIIVIIFIGVLVAYLGFMVLFSRFSRRHFTNRQRLEYN